MNNFLQGKIYTNRYLFLAMGVLGFCVLAFLPDSSYFDFRQAFNAISLFPFFVLGNGGSCQCGSGSCTGGCGANCRCNCTNCCGNNTGSCGSTPFLYIKTKNGFEMDNDVMFGKPTSLFGSLEKGIEAHKAGNVKPDLYIVQKNVEIIDGKIQFQIKEIEPEVSALSFIALERVLSRKNETLITLGDFSGCVRVRDFSNKTLVCSDKEQKNITHQLAVIDDKQVSTTENAVTLETGDFIDVTFDAGVGSEKYLLLQSWYRDWNLGSVYSEAGAFDAYLSPYQKTLYLVKTKTARGLLSGFVATVIGYLGLTGNFTSTSDDASLLSSKFGFGALSASADNLGPRSLELSYLENGTQNRVRYEVISPRYKRPATVAVRVPEECIQNGKGKIRVTATKKHKVSGISVVDAVTVPREAFETLSLTSAYHHRDKKDYKDTFDSNKVSNTGEYVHTSPSDVITLTFDAKNTNESYEYLVNVSGVYTPASKEAQAKMGDWTNKLDGEALAFLSEVYHQSDSVVQRKV